MAAIDGVLILWCVVTGFSAGCMAFDFITRTPATTVMEWGWVLVILDAGRIGLFA